MPFYKTVIQIEVLSEEPLHTLDTLTEIDESITTGNNSGAWTLFETTEISPEELIEECAKQGTDPEFFGVELEDSDE